MTDYTRLVAALRNNDWSDACPCCDEAMCKDADCIILQAADAIEVLQKTLKAVQTNSGINFRMLEEAQAEVERLISAAEQVERLVSTAEQAQLPKRGEIVRCRECKHRYDGECPLSFDNGKMPDDWFCADGKREVQE